MTMTRTACHTLAMRGITVAAAAAALITAVGGSTAIADPGETPGGVPYDLTVATSCAHLEVGLTTTGVAFHWVVAGPGPGPRFPSRMEGNLIPTFPDHDAFVALEFPRRSGEYRWRVVIDGHIVRRVHVQTNCG